MTPAWPWPHPACSVGQSGPSWSAPGLTLGPAGPPRAALGSPHAGQVPGSEITVSLPRLSGAPRSASPSDPYLLFFSQLLEFDKELSVFKDRLYELDISFPPR